MHENESVPVIMLDPDDVKTVTACQSSIRQSMTYITQILKKYAPDGVDAVSVYVSGLQYPGECVVDGWLCLRHVAANVDDPLSMYTTVNFNDLSTDTILRAFNRACADFKTQTTPEEDNDE